MVNKLAAGAVVVVTGAGSGIGRATAAAFAAGGATVICADVDGDAAEKTAALCAERGGTGRAERCDVTDAAAVIALAGRTGPVDVLVNNAGVGMTGRFADMTVDDWRWIRSVNLDGVVHGCAAFGPGMVARRSGQVVNVSSGLAYTMRATEAAYVTTKAAVLALSRCLRADWAEYGVGVTAVCPGFVNTPLRNQVIGPDGKPWVDQPQPPFRIWSVEKCVDEVIRVIVKRRAHVSLPWWMKWLLRLDEIVDCWVGDYILLYKFPRL